MTESAAITIRRQILDVEVHGTQSDGLALQRRLPGVCAHLLSPALESALVRFDPGDAHLCVERLVIDVSGLPLDRLDAELVEAVQREVADYFRRNAPMPSEVARVREVGDLRLRTVAETVDEGLIVFLRTGRLPWSFPVPPGSRLEQLMLDTWGAADANRGPPPATRARLLQTLALPSARARLVMQFTPGFVAAVLGGVSRELAVTIEEVLATLGDVHPHSPTGLAFARQLWDAVLLAAATGHRPGPNELARAAWRGLAPLEREDRTVATVLERRWPGATEQHDAPPVGDEVDASRPGPSPPPVGLAEEPDGQPVPSPPPPVGLAQEPDGQPVPSPPPPVGLAQEPDGQPVPSPPPPVGLAQEPDGQPMPSPPPPVGLAQEPDGQPVPSPPPPVGLAQEPDGQPVPSPPPPVGLAQEPDGQPVPSPPLAGLAQEPDGILVDNAGVVLLHPFLPRFLEGLGVATADELLDPGRALCLLHHLATGELTAPEHHLTLAKALCGVPLDEPVEADVGLTAAETDEATALLDAAIGYWGALRGTSSGAMRGEFLMRPGALAVDPDGDWVLRVEARTVDILLDQLPWGISLIKLPWMDRLLRVEWR